MTGLEYLIVMAIMMIVSTAITMSMMPDPVKAVADQMEVSTADEGTPIPVCFGTNLIKQSNVIWYGDPSTTEIKSDGGKK